MVTSSLLALPDDCFLHMVSYLNYQDLINLTQVETGLGIRFGRREFWYQLLLHKYPHLIGKLKCDLSLDEYKNKTWLGERYYFRTMSIKKEPILLASHDREFMAGVCFAFHSFRLRCTFPQSQIVLHEFCQPGLISILNQLESWVQPYKPDLRDPRFRDYVQARQATQELLDTGHRLFRVCCHPFKYLEVTWWYVRPFYVVDLGGRLEEGLLELLKHLGIEKITAQEVTLDNLENYLVDIIFG